MYARNGPSRVFFLSLKTLLFQIRSEMDEVFLQHAEKQGVKVFQETRVESIEFQGDPASSRPIAANWENKDGSSGKITFDWLIDASGRTGIMSTKYLSEQSWCTEYSRFCAHRFNQKTVKCERVCEIQRCGDIGRTSRDMQRARKKQTPAGLRR